MTGSWRCGGTAWGLWCLGAWSLCEGHSCIASPISVCDPELEAGLGRWVDSLEAGFAGCSAREAEYGVSVSVLHARESCGG